MPSPPTDATPSTKASSAAACCALGAGHFDEADFAAPLAQWCPPLHLAAWGHDLWTVPPPSQGYLTLAGAAVADLLGLGADPDDPAWAHLLVEAWRAVGHDRPDVLFDGADGAALLAPERLAAARGAYFGGGGGGARRGTGSGHGGPGHLAAGRRGHDPPVRH